ncbi:element excision factor XisH family protein [Geminocystis sp. CENA526]|uniref:element excision factor XisH family protein n=1 Tax=Geminocystis sp. CENA526 TaxID=1355871 RepID=UPI003D6E9932
MMARDLFHNIVRLALEKDGWIITDDPLNIQVGGIDVQIDLGAQKLLAAEKNDEKIAVEVKNFVSASKISEFHMALGQFINYRTALRTVDQNRILYLAVPSPIYDSFFSLPFIQTIINENKLKLTIYNVDKEEIEKWIN